MTPNQNRRHGLLADLNFNLPFISRSSAKQEYDCIVSYAIGGGGRRKMDRFAIDFTEWHKRINEDETGDLFTPKCVAIANDRNNNLFAVFDDESIAESVDINYNEKTRTYVLTSKAAVLKFFIVMRVIRPEKKGAVTKLTFKMKNVNNDKRLWQLEPMKLIIDEVGMLQPRVTELR